MASHQFYGRAEHQEPGNHMWNQQPGLEVDPSQKYNVPRKPSVRDTVQTGHYKVDETGRPVEQKRSRNPFGLSPLAFGLLVALATAIIVGGAVGGGVGSQIKPSHNSKAMTVNTSASAPTKTVFLTKTATTAASQTTSSSAFYTDYVAALPSQVLSVPLDCPNLNSESHTTVIGDKFVFACGVDYFGNDLVALIAYRVEDCCTACSAYNYQQKSSGLSSRCGAFTFNANMSYAYANENPPGGNNCWLKSQSDQGIVNEGNMIVGGKLA